IEADEYEKDLRRILNYGHTFGHALEALTNHAVPHGLGVAWGLDLVNSISLDRGLLDKGIFDEVHAFVKRYLPLPKTSLPSAAASAAGRGKRRAAFRWRRCTRRRGPARRRRSGPPRHTPRAPTPRPAAASPIRPA